MIRVHIPQDNLAERSYILNIIFTEFLGLPYEMLPGDDRDNYHIVFDDKEIIIKDAFFSQYRDDLSYLTDQALPGGIAYCKNDFTVESDIPVIYGNGIIQILSNKIICGIDIFASSFFMLTRWEEYVNKKRDSIDRFPGSQSIAVKQNFISRPVVNEYAEMLWNMMQKLGIKLSRQKQKFEITITHDIDFLRYSFIRSIGDIVINRKSVLLVFKHLRYLFSEDPYNTFDFLMNISESLGIRSHFYFMSSDSGLKYDTRFYINDKRFRTTVSRIKERNHIIGFHPGFYTYNNDNRWIYEKRVLEEAINQETKEGRQHYLRMDVSKTLPIWDHNRMETDSTLGYANFVGFRCGTGNIFTVFDFLNRKQLKLIERPLIIMDSTLRSNSNFSHTKAKEICSHYISTGKKYNTGITFLFHNASFIVEWDGYDSVYKDILTAGCLS